MLFSRDYRKPFWRGLLHALFIVFYSLFISLLLMSVSRIFAVGEDLGQVMQFTFTLFSLVVSIAIYAYLIFFEPMKLIIHKHFKAGSVMLWSTLGWCMIFLFIFVIGLAYTLQTV